MDNRAVDFISGLSDQSTSDEAWDAACRFFKAEGFSLVSHGYMPKRGINQNFDPTSSLRVACEKPILDFYFHHGFQYDPIFHKHSPGLNPFFSGPDFTDLERDGEEYCSIMDELQELGVNSGLVVPLLNQQSGDLGRVLVGSPLRGKDLSSLIGERGEIYRLAALIADERLRVLPSRAEIEAIGLSMRECECLLWLANGYRVDRIAEKLGITNATVNLHFANAKKKLQSATREQALARAISFGIITP